MQSLEVSGAVRPIYGSLSVKRLSIYTFSETLQMSGQQVTHNNTKHKHKHERTCIPHMGLYPTTPIFKMSKGVYTVYCLIVVSDV